MADFGFGWPVRRHVAEKSVEVTEEFPPLGVVARFLFSRMAHRDISGFVVLDEASVCGRRARKWSGERREAHSASQSERNGRRRRTADGSLALLRSTRD